MQKNELTIKQISDKTGISSQKIYRYIKQNKIKGLHHEQHHDKAPKYYDDETVSKIVSYFLKDASSGVSSFDEDLTKNDEEVDEALTNDKKIQKLELRLDFFETQVNKLTDLLITKEEQISMLTKLIAMSSFCNTNCNTKLLNSNCEQKFQTEKRKKFNWFKEIFKKFLNR